MYKLPTSGRFSWATSVSTYQFLDKPIYLEPEGVRNGGARCPGRDSGGAEQS